MPFEVMLSFAMALLILFSKPGPDMIGITSRALRDGFYPAASMASGIVVAQWIYISVFTLGLQVLLPYMDFLQILFQSIGAALFIYLGVRGFANLDAGQWEQHKKKSRNASIRDNFLTGLMICLGNPIIILFYVSLYPGMIDLSEAPIEKALIACLLVLIFNGGPSYFIAWMAGRVRNTLKNPNVVRWLNIVTSSIMILIGFFVGLSAMPIIDIADIYFSMIELFRETDLYSLGRAYA